MLSCRWAGQGGTSGVRGLPSAAGKKVLRANIQSGYAECAHTSPGWMNGFHSCVSIALAASTAAAGYQPSLCSSQAYAPLPYSAPLMSARHQPAWLARLLHGDPSCESGTALPWARTSHYKEPPFCCRWCGEAPAWRTPCWPASWLLMFSFSLLLLPLPVTCVQSIRLFTNESPSKDLLQPGFFLLRPHTFTLLVSSPPHTLAQAQARSTPRTMNKILSSIKTRDQDLNWRLWKAVCTSGR